MQLNQIGSSMYGKSNDSIGCQEFAQNAWKKDLCSNCYKPRSDHGSTAAVAEVPAVPQGAPTTPAPCWCEPARGHSAAYKYELNRVLSSASNSNLGSNNNNNNSIFINNNNQKNNDIGRLAKKSIGSNGALLWEVGHSLTASPQTTPDDADDVHSGSHESKHLNGQTNGPSLLNGHCNGVQGLPKVTSSSSASRVGFRAGSPQVIGYGGDDYDDDDDWGSDDQDRQEDEDKDQDDEPSDLDSLEGFQMSAEEKAFSQLTDQNTEFNAYNGNLLSTTDDELPLSPPLYAMPIKSTIVKTMKTATARTVHPDEGDGACVQESSPSSSSSPPPPPLTLPPPTMSSHAASSSANAKEFIVSNLYSTSPASTSDTEDFLDAEDYPPDDSRPTSKVPVADIHQMQSKAGFQSVPARLSSNQRQSVQDLFKEEPVTAAERRAAFKNSLPIPSKVLTRNGTTKPPSTDQPSNYSRPRMAPQIPTSLPPDSQDDRLRRLPIQVAKTAGNNHSCHYASSYVTTAPPPPKGMTLPATPLTNPYSSMSITKLQQQQQQPSVDKPQPPPAATKPKPKLPAKPSGVITRRNQAASQQVRDYKDGRQPLEDINQRVINRTSALYQEIDENVPTKTKDVTQDIDTSSESKSGNTSTDANRRTTPKRRAPKPPTQESSTVLDASESEDVPVRNTRSCSLSNLKDSPLPTLTTTPIRQSPPKMSVMGRSQTLNSRTSTTSLDSYGSKAEGGEGHSPSSSSGAFKDAKLKKNRFSLKKLLKFGGPSKDDDAKTKANSIGREKIQILHPIDLMTDGQSGSHATKLDVTSTTAIQEVQKQQTVTSEATPTVEPSTNKPPLPRRTQSPMDQDDQSVSSSGGGSREKPVRPPPPVKQFFRQNTKSSLGNSGPTASPNGNTDAGGNGNNRPDSDQRNSIYDSGMEYANLGDIRTSVTPKKPGRCTSSMTDIATDNTDDRMSQSTSHTSLQNYSYPRQQCQINSEIQMYYSSPNEEDWPTETDDDDLEDNSDLYVDQAATPDATNDQSSRSSSSFTSEVMTALDGHRRQPYNSLDQRQSGQDEPAARSPDQGCMSKDIARTSTPAAADSDYTETASRTSRTATDVDWSTKKSNSSRLSLRKARSIVHRNLEDNYGAVVSANHQTLTQILDQVSQGQQVSASSKLKVLEDVPLRWSAFNVVEESRVAITGKMAFYSAVWQQTNLDVTLLVSSEPLNVTAALSRNPCILTPSAEFQDDHIPQDYVMSDVATESKLRQATVWVLDRMRVESMTSMSEHLHLLAWRDVDSYERDSCFVLLQLINGLKHLQAQGIEEVDGSLDDFLLVTKAKDTNYRLLFVPSTLGGMSHHHSNDLEGLSLCQCALKAMLLLLCIPNSLLEQDNDDMNSPSSEKQIDQLEFLSAKPAFRLIGDILLQERATSLSRAKLLLEYMIWGPADELVTDDDATNEDGDHLELAYHRWLDLERATVLNNLIRTQSLWQIRLTVFEECMLSFLVRTCAKTLRDAANQLRKAAETMSILN